VAQEPLYTILYTIRSRWELIHDFCVFSVYGLRRTIGRFHELPSGPRTSPNHFGVSDVCRTDARRFCF